MLSVGQYCVSAIYLSKLQILSESKGTVFKQENSLNPEQIQILLDLVNEQKQRALATQRAGLEIMSEGDSDRHCPHKFKKTLARPSVVESEL